MIASIRARADRSSFEWEELVSKLVHQAVAPHAADVDLAGRFPLEAMEQLAESGLMGLLIPAEYGGIGGSIRDFTRVTDRLAQGCVTAAAVYLFHNQVARRIVQFGTKEQKASFLPKLATGEWLAASSWTELTAGADKSGTKSVAEMVDADLVINGQKAFCTGAGMADLYTVLLRTGSAAGQELSFVVLFKEDEGVLFGSSWDGMGLRGSSTKEIVCRDVVVPKDRTLGGEFGTGSRMMGANRATAIHPGIMSLGLAKAAIAVLREHLESKPHLWEFQNTRMTLSDLLIKVHALELLVYRAAEMADLGSPLAAQATMEAKALGAMTGTAVADQVLQMCGALGYTRGHKIERLSRDAKAIGLMGPTTELCKEYMAADWRKGGAERWEESILTY